MPTAAAPAPSEPPAAPGREEQILEAALRVFAERGFKAATIKRIAQEAGLKSPALLYWYFPNKEAMFGAVLSRFGTVLGQVPDDLPDIDTPPEQLLPELLSRVLARFEDPRTLQVYRVLLLEIPLMQAAGFNLRAERPINLFAFLEDYFARQVELGRLRPHDPREAARSVVALISFNVQSRSSGILEPPGPDDEWVAFVTRLLIDGLS